MTLLLPGIKGLIYIKDLSDYLSSNAKLFANDISLFSTVHDNILANELTLSAPNPQNGQTHSNNLSATGHELSKYVWAF